MVWSSDLCPLLSWQYVGHNTQQDVHLLLSPIEVTLCDDWEGLLEPFYSLLTSPAAAYRRTSQPEGNSGISAPFHKTDTNSMSKAGSHVTV